MARHHGLRIVVVAAVEQARPPTPATFGLEDIEQDFARDGAEGETTRARFVFFASASAPDDVCAIARAVSLAFIGSEQVTSTFPERSPACFKTSLTRDQWTARSTTSAPSAASPGVPVQLPLTARVTKDDVVPGFREDCAELSAHQTRTENSDTHVRVL
jgi:hypothetical protein